MSCIAGGSAREADGVELPLKSGRRRSYSARSLPLWGMVGVGPHCSVRRGDTDGERLIGREDK